MRGMSLPSMFHENGKLQNTLYWKVLKHGNGNGNLIESNEIIKNSVALEDEEKAGIKGVNLVMKQAPKDKKNATCFMVKNTVPVALAERFNQASMMMFRPR
jgi:hypothetical protein